MTLGTSWQTRLSGIVVAAATVLFGVPTLLTAITEWSQHRPVEWRPVVIAVGMAAAAAGLAAAKARQVHGGTIDSGERPDKVQSEIAIAKVSETKK
jgi:hypothetical protein